MPPTCSLLFLFGATCLAAQTISSPTNNYAPIEEDTGDDWEYEPRVWSYDQNDNEPPVDEQFRDPFQHDDTVDHMNYGTSDIFKPINYDDDKLTDNKIRAKNYFWESRKQVHPRQEPDQEEDKCNQFRVDIRETVICDKKRCDKLDFEWPIHDNQLTLIETTKYGMRFHRADFAFGSADQTYQRQRKQQPDASIRLNRVVKSRIKFDILDLFKPKPSSSTSAPPPSDGAAPTTVQPEHTTRTTTISPQAQNDTTTASPINSTDISSQDNNTTQLITTFRLDTRRRVQTILGFGGALSDSSCRNIKSLSPDMSKSLMEDYFGALGLRYNIVRMSIGSSDFSTTPYTNNDKIEPKTINKLLALDEYDDVEMKNFRLVGEDYKYKLPVARQAIATSNQEIKFLSSLWSPPIWMKNNSHIVHGWLKGDVYGPYYKALADLIIKWLEAYRKNGIEFWATTGLNEPVTGIKPFIFHNSLGITREDYVTFIKLYLGPMLRRRGFSNVKLIAMDDNKGYAPQLAKALLDDKETAKYVSGIGVHWYMNDEYENLNFLVKEFPEKFIISTEASNGYLPYQVHTLPGDWHRGVAYMYDIIKLIQKNAVGWVDWNMALDLGGGPSWANNLLDSPVIVNAERDEYYKSPTFYAIGHFSRFVEPNSTRLDHRLANAKYDYPLEAVGFYTPKNYVVIVVLNANRHPVPFRVIVDRQLVKIVTLREESFNTIVFKWKSKE